MRNNTSKNQSINQSINQSTKCAKRPYIIWTAALNNVTIYNRKTVKSQ